MYSFFNSINVGEVLGNTGCNLRVLVQYFIYQHNFQKRLASFKSAYYISHVSITQSYKKGEATGKPL